MLKFIRNFCIIAHIDHGKSTLADRFLELTEQVDKRKMHSQFLDMMDLERERGITIKMQPVRMKYKHNNEEYMLNLIDTPGHIDFNYEVSRSLAAVEGAILLVDATKGIQAQTMSNLYLALDEGLTIIPVINKIDLPNAQTELVKKQLSSILGVDESEIISISAKDGTNVEEVLKIIVEKIPSPEVDIAVSSPRALIFDSQFDKFKGVILYLRVFNGIFDRNKKIVFIQTGLESEVLEVGAFNPSMTVENQLKEGEIGYLATGLKKIEGVRIGDTISDLNGQIMPDQVLPGYKEPQPMVFANIFPQSNVEEDAQTNDFSILKDGLEKLRLNDSSISIEPISDQALGRGFRCGFLGLLHLDIVVERLKREYGIELIIGSPSVLYKGADMNKNEKYIYSPSEFDPSKIVTIKEPFVRLEVLTPKEYLGFIMKVLDGIRGIYKNTSYIDENVLIISYEAPLAEIITDFYDKIKSSSSGYASLSYDIIDWRESDLVKLDIMIAGEIFESFSKIAPRSKAVSEGRAMLKKLKEILPRQWFQVSLQAAIGGKIVAREDIKALRKDVTGYLYGGDYSRKRKLLEKQKKGKKKMKSLGKVNVPSDVFLKMLKV